MIPDDRKYTKSHEWIRIDGDEAVVGITDYAQNALGDITYVELPEVGHVVDAGEESGVIESTKAASEIYAPVSGEISDANVHLEEEPEIINRDPYDDGWIFKMRDFDEEEVEALLDAPDYSALLEREE